MRLWFAKLKRPSLPRRHRRLEARDCLENIVLIEGSLIESDALRFTPAGISILKFRLAHQSRQGEAGEIRDVGFEIDAVAFEANARLLATAPLGTRLQVKGFLDRKTRSGRAVVLHANQIEYVVTQKT